MKTMSGRGGRGLGGRGRGRGRAAAAAARANDVGFERAFGAVAAAGPFHAPPPPATTTTKTMTTRQNPGFPPASEVPRRTWRGRKRAPPPESESDVDDEMYDEMEEEVRPAPAPAAAAARGVNAANLTDRALPPAASTITRPSNRDFGVAMAVAATAAGLPHGAAVPAPVPPPLTHAATPALANAVANALPPPPRQQIAATAILPRPQQQPQQQPPPEPNPDPDSEPEPEPEPDPDPALLPPPLPLAPGQTRTMPPRRLKVPKDIGRYKSTLLRFMTYTNRIAYPKDYEFSMEELGAITPESIYRWMCSKVYGIPEPSPADNPRKGASNSLLVWKKQISLFIPNSIIRPVCGVNQGVLLEGEAQHRQI